MHSKIFQIAEDLKETGLLSEGDLYEDGYLLGHSDYFGESESSRMSDLNWLAKMPGITVEGERIKIDKKSILKADLTD